MPFTDELLQFNNEVFFETGTYQGDTTEKVLRSGRFDKVITMELSPHYHGYAKQRFAGDTRVEVVHGNSRTDLFRHIEHIDVPITFWLDGHWSGVPFIGEDGVTKCPVLFELEQIQRHPIKNHTIIIDDIRLMDGDHFPVHRHEIEEALCKINPEYTLRYFPDDLSAEDVLVAHLF